MPNSATLAQLRTRARRRADMENSNFVSDAELTDFINSSYSELYDVMVTRYEDYYVGTPTSFSLSAGTNTYSLPSDFYKLRGVDYKADGQDFIELYTYNWNERGRRNNPLHSLAYSRVNLTYRIVGSSLYILPEDNAAGDYQLWYIPSFTPLSSDSDLVDSHIARNGWEEYIVVDAARKMLIKEESDIRPLLAEKDALLKRIESASANRDIDQPERISDVTRNRFNRELDWY